MFNKIKTMNRGLGILLAVSCLAFSGCDDPTQSAKLNQGGLGDSIVYDEGSIRLNSCVYQTGSLTYGLSLFDVSDSEITKENVELVDCVEPPVLWDPIPLASLSILEGELTLVFSLDDQLAEKIEAGIQEQPKNYGMVTLEFLHSNNKTWNSGMFSLQYKSIALGI